MADVLEKTGNDIDNDLLKDKSITLEVRKSSGGLSPVMDTPLIALDPDVRELFADPDYGNGTKISALLSRCAVAVLGGVLNVPNNLLLWIERRARNSERMLPATAVQLHQKVVMLKEMTVSRSVGIMKDVVSFYIPDALDNIKNAKSNMIQKFLKAMLELAEDVKAISSKYGDQNTYYLAQNLGEKIPIDTDSLAAPLQSCIVKLNKMSAGLGGYYILALLKLVDDARALISDRAVRSLYGEKSSVGLFNKLGFRRLANDMAIHKNLCKLADYVTDYAEKSKANPMYAIDKTSLIELILLCDKMQRDMPALLAMQNPENPDKEMKSAQQTLKEMAVTSTKKVSLSDLKGMITSAKSAKGDVKSLPQHEEDDEEYEEDDSEEDYEEYEEDDSEEEE